MDTITINSNKNSSININNNSFNQDNEKVFWKVIHNKFLFNIIFEFIVAVDPGSFKSHEQIHIDYRRKFKDIDSLEWMLKNKQYELLKCKLQNNEYINFDGIPQLVSLGKDIFQDKEIDQKVTNKQNQIQMEHQIYNEDEQKEKDNEKEQEIQNKQLKKRETEKEKDFKLLNELLYLILIKHGDRYKQLIDTGVLLKAASTASIKAFKLLVNEPYSLKIKKSIRSPTPYIPLLENLIQNASPVNLDVVIKSVKDIEITEEFKNQSIYTAFKNVGYQEPMISYILSNPQLYNKSYKDDIKNNLNNNNKYTNKRIKTLNDSSSYESIQSVTNLSDPDSDSSDSDSAFEGPEIDPTAIVKLGINQFLTIKSTELQNQLLDLNYVYIEKMLNSINNVDLLKEIINSGYNGNNEHSRGGRLKEIYKILVKAEIVKYEDYLEKYNQVISGLDINIAIQYTLTKFSASVLKSLLSSKYITDYISTNIKLIKYMLDTTSPLDYSINNITTEFIQLLTSSQCTHSLISDSYYSKYLLSNYLKSNEKYQEIIQIFTSSTVSKEYKELLPLTWNEIIYQLIRYSEELTIIKDKETIDWIIDNIDKSSLLRSKLELLKDNIVIQFESLELLNYATERFNSNPTLSTPLTCSIITFSNYLFFKYIGECNIVGLKLTNFDQIPDTPHYLYLNQFLKEINKLSKQSTENIIKLLKYLNETGFKGFTVDLLFNIIFNVIYEKLSKLPDVDNHAVVYGFNWFKSMAHHRLLNSITAIKPSIIKTILNEYNSFEDNDYNETIHYFKRIKEVKIGMESKFKTQDTISSDIIKCIEIFLNLTNNNIKEEFNQVYSNIINYLFKRLIQSKNTTIDQVKQVYNLITIHNSTTMDLSKEVKIQHSLFQVWYCLAIRSPILIKYILELPFLTENKKNNENDDDDDDDDDYDENDGDIVYDGYCIKKYLDPLVFTFDFIFNTQVDEILEALVYHLSIKPFFEDQEMVDHINQVSYYSYLPSSLNSNLIFFLTIRRIDLFFKHISLIQSMLATNSKINADPKEFSNHTFDYRDVDNEKEPDLICQQCNNDVDIKPISKTEKVFYYTNVLFWRAYYVLDSQQFQKFVKLYSFHSIRDCFLSILGRTSVGFCRLIKIYKIINHLFTNHNPKKYGLKGENYHQYWDESTINELGIETIRKHKELLFSGELISEQRILELSKLLELKN